MKFLSGEMHATATKPRQRLALRIICLRPGLRGIRRGRCMSSGWWFCTVPACRSRAAKQPRAKKNPRFHFELKARSAGPEKQAPRRRCEISPRHRTHPPRDKLEKRRGFSAGAFHLKSAPDKYLQYAPKVIT